MVSARPALCARLLFAPQSRSKPPDLDEALCRASVELIARVVGRERLIVEGVRGLAADDVAIAFEEFESDRSCDARLNRAHEGVYRFARLREPESVVDEVRVGASEVVLDPLEVPRDDELLQLAVRRVEHDGGRRLVLRAT